MIASLRGKVIDKHADGVTLEIGGVGYGVALGTADLGIIHTDSEQLLYIYEHLRENAHELFGFLDKRALGLFMRLLNVNGVGPKMALAIMSLGRLDDVQSAISRRDVKYIQSASGVGKKLAERIIVDLKDAFSLSGNSDEAFVGMASIRDEAVLALEALGYSREDAQHALSSVDASLPVDERVKQALRVR